MREIKFRAWIKDAPVGYSDTGMYYQEDQYLSSFIRRIYSQYMVSHPSYLDFELEDRLMQYTGLKDKDGKEIYEGDIVENDNNIKLHIYFDNRDCSFRQSSNLKNPKNEGECNIQAIYPHERMDFSEKQYTNLPINFNNNKVIGNIYENPELLDKD